MMSDPKNSTCRTLSLSYLKGSADKIKESQQKFASNRIVTSRYTLLTFLPKNLFEQFRRMVNFFFVCLIIIQVSIDIPVNPIAYSAAFIFVIGVTGVKQGYEDWCRHRADNKVNFANVNVLVPSTRKVSKIYSKDIRVGHILKVNENEDVLCDLLLISCESKSGEVQSFCQITTANLDGESNLKMRSCPSKLTTRISENEDNSLEIENLSKLSLKYDNPDPNLNKLNGEINNNQTSAMIPFTMENCVLRGSQVKNCGHIYGIVIYTGKDTRLSMNSNKPKTSKFSTIERTMNKIVIGMFVVLIILASSSVGLSFLYKNNTFDEMWYLPQDETSNSKHGVTIFFSYLVLLCYLIPVSLSVSFELQKLACSKFFPWDREMTCEKTGAKPLCNTSDLNEELGQIQYLFTDKTGTLTDNDLVLNYFSVNGVKYKFNNDDGSLYELNESEASTSESLVKPPYNEELKKFLEVMALCHSVKILKQTPNDTSVICEDPQYQSSSLDEVVLVKAAYRLGTKFIEECNDQVTLSSQGQTDSYTRLCNLEFDSERKCMSVILKSNRSGQVFLFSKGAESSILPNCETSENSNLIKSINNDVLQFAKAGLRTMVMAYRNLSDEEANSFLKKQQDLKDRPAELISLFKSVECNLIPLGCTGVEDKLQEGVGETLEALQEAGIRVLMLTGDKLETAVSIATSCGLIKSETTGQDEDKLIGLAIISAESNAESVEKKLEIIKEEMDQGKIKSLVMDGSSFAMAVEKYKRTLAFIMINAASVIFCRMAPLQKSQAVNMLKNYRGKVLKTCAVGDGGNDCAMLREAHLGIGIIGKEGLQAARESDFAVARFRFLKKAILVHGYWYYHRLASLITYFFYRGVVFIFLIVLYGFDNGFSATTIFDSTFVMMFTISFTSVPVVVQGVTDQFLTKEELLEDPTLYKTLRDNKLMNFSKTWRWFVVGAWQIAVCYYIPRFVWLEGLSGFHDYGAFSLFVSSCIVVIADFKILVEASYFTWATVVAQLFSYMTMLGFYSILCQLGTNSSGLLSFSYYPLLQQTEFWLSILLVAILGVIPDLTWKALSHE